MKVPCPLCNVVLTLPDSLAEKNTKCPACQQAFVAPPLRVEPGAKPKKSKQPVASSSGQELQAVAEANPQFMADPVDPNDELGLVAVAENPRGKQGPADPSQIDVCPGCGQAWKKGKTQCNKCRYNVIVGAKVKAPPKQKLNLNIDMGKLLTYAFVLGVAYGLYMLSANWDNIIKYINGGMNNATRSAPSVDDGGNITPSKPVHKERE